ncbi:hypothetical protein ACLOJK_029661 [Asimina triloba]
MVPGRADHLSVRRPSTESHRQQRLTHDPSARLWSVAWIILQKPVSSIRQRLPSASNDLFRPDPGTPSIFCPLHRAASASSSGLLRPNPETHLHKAPAIRHLHPTSSVGSVLRSARLSSASRSNCIWRLLIVVGSVEDDLPAASPLPVDAVVDVCLPPSTASRVRRLSSLPAAAVALSCRQPVEIPSFGEEDGAPDGVLQRQFFRYSSGARYLVHPQQTISFGTPSVNDISSGPCPTSVSQQWAMSHIRQSAVGLVSHPSVGSGSYIRQSVDDIGSGPHISQSVSR